MPKKAIGVEFCSPYWVNINPLPYKNIKPKGNIDF